MTLVLPYNYGQALGALSGLSKRFGRDPTLAEDYVKFMEELIDGGIIEEVPKHQLRGRAGKVFLLVSSLCISQG